MAYTKRNNNNQPSNELFAGLGLIALIIGSLYLVFDPTKNATRTEDAAAAEYVYDLSGWYLYQTKVNNFFQIKYPNDWLRAYANGFEGEEYFEARTPSAGIILRVWARTNERYPNLNSFMDEINSINKASSGFRILKERKITIAGRPAIQREGYNTLDGYFSVATYIFDQDAVVEFYTDLPEAQKISSYYVTLHNTLLDTFNFIN
ncbi:MAG: hypothetical protein WAP55_03465 [Minisyncoccia bacterium]